MLEAIQKLLILQDPDRHIRRVESELGRIGPERQGLRARISAAQTALEAGKLRVMQLENERKQLELAVDGKKELIARYANQQLQTRKNEEYRALAHEIEMCQESIRKIEDQQLELMEQGETAQRAVVQASEDAKKAREFTDGQIAGLDGREASLTAELAQLKTNREELAAAVDEVARSRYERLIKTRGDNIVVGIEHGVCGGCHMRLPAQIIVTCRAEQELVTCTNCGRVLYYGRDMDMAVAE